MFNVSNYDEIKLTRNDDGTYKVEGKAKFFNDDKLQDGNITINRSEVTLIVDALLDDNETIATFEFIT